jgi:hypothetical protein
LLEFGGSTYSVAEREQRELLSGGVGSHETVVQLNLKMSETRILITFLWMYFPQKWEFGSPLSKLLNVGGEGRVWLNREAPRFPTLNVYIYPKIAHNKAHIVNVYYCKKPCF